MKIGKRVRIKVEEILRELLVANGWRRDSQVYGTVVQKVGERVGVNVGGDVFSVDVGGTVLWFDEEVLEDAQRHLTLESGDAEFI